MNATAERFAETLAATFPGLGGRYLEQTATREGWSSTELSPAVFVRHVQGQERIGRRYDPARLAWAAFDLDGKKHLEGRAWALATAQRIVNAIAELGVESFMEESRSCSGFHVWILFDDDGPSLETAREFAGALLRVLGLPDTFTESEGVPGFYPWPPKEKDCGRVPYLPLHGACNGNASGLLCNRDGEPLADQFAALVALRRTPRQTFEAALASVRSIAPKPAAPEPVRRPAVERRPFTGELTPWAETALKNECAELAGWPKGSAGGRHSRIFKAAAQLGEIVAGGGLPADLVRSSVFDAAIACGAVADYGEAKVRVQIESGLARGELNPRRPEPAPARPASPRDEEAPSEPAWLREENEEPAESTIEAEAEPTVTTENTADEPTDLEDIAELPEACWRPGFAEFRAAWSHTTEAPDAFLWSAYATAAGCVLGRKARLRLGVEIFPNGYRANVGASGRARKSTGQSKADRLLSRVDESVRTLHGIGSPEGLIEALEPEIGHTSRVFVNLGELSTLLRKAKAEATSGLSPLLCTLFDCPPAVSLPNRKKPLEASDPFVVILGSTTGDWLRGDLTIQDVRGGLAGRFEYFTGRSKAAVPLPPPPDVEALNEAERILIDARDRHATAREYAFDPQAAALYEAWYVEEHRREYPSAILDVLAQRLHVFAWKTALVFAAIEGTETVTAPQVDAALVFADYQREVQRTVFGAFGTSVLQQTIDRVMAALKKHGPLSSREIVHRVRHVEMETVVKALSTCCRGGLIEQRVQGRKRVWALIGQRLGNASGNGSSPHKKKKEEEE